MNVKFPLASTAALIADPARAAMLMALLDGCALAAGELARAANVSAQSASMHLAQLLDGGFVKVAQDGRHRYYCIATSEVAHAIEALGVISSPRKRKPIGEDNAITYARTCYDHLAGELAVGLAAGFEDQGLLVAIKERDYQLTARGEEFFAQWQIDVAALRALRRNFARRCLDWTERRDHLGGALGTAIYRRFLELHWISRDRNSRVVRLTPLGARHLHPLLGSSAAASQSFSLH